MGLTVLAGSKALSRRGLLDPSIKLAYDPRCRKADS